MDEIRQVSLEGYEVVGKGGCGTIYKIDGDRVLKLFDTRISLEEIKREQAQTKYAHDMGLGVEDCFELVKCDDRYGLILEYVSGEDADKILQREPQHTADFGKQLGEYLRKIHSVKPDVQVFPSTEEFYHSCVEKCEYWLTQEEQKRLHAFISAIPKRNTMIHGDYNQQNTIVQDGRLVLIDIANSTTGHPVYDLLLTYFYMVMCPRDMRESYDRARKTAPEDSFRLWDVLIKTYLGTDDPQRINGVNNMLEYYAMLKLILTPASFINMKRERWEFFINWGRNKLIPEIDRVIGIVDDVL